MPGRGGWSTRDLTEERELDTLVRRARALDPFAGSEYHTVAFGLAHIYSVSRQAVLTVTSDPHSSPAPRLRQSAPQDLREDDRFVVLAVAGAVDERQRAGPRLAPERRQPRTLAAKLLDVAPAKLLKAVRLVPKPLPELGARCQLLLPVI